MPQLALLAYLLADCGAQDFGVPPGSRAHGTVVFNVFVLCQARDEPPNGAW